ncbi:hypothetical protein ANCCAN_06239 [Ancylostoma caninum]|uniref:Uncharacterized protein n=1 Tax=Ancylostoma caninum TaxID=29170 RepID=A0A368GXC0_ANCCA|nr:hypothetical protein ANCCAN_06239 [Ancylostoma caninum]
MFSRSKKQQLPSYIEGTQGLYVKRASPPPVPSLSSHTHTLAKKTSSATVDVSASNNNVTCTNKTSVTVSQPAHVESRALKTESVAVYTDGSAVRPHSDSALSATSTYSLPPSHGHLAVNHLDAVNERKSPIANLSSQSFR